MHPIYFCQLQSPWTVHDVMADLDRPSTSLIPLVKTNSNIKNPEKNPRVQKDPTQLPSKWVIVLNGP